MVEKEQPEEKERVIHHPEYVILDKEEEPQTQKGPQSEYVENMQAIGKMSFGWPVRILCFLGCIVATLATAFVAALSMISVILSGLVLFSSKEINEQMFKALHNVRKMIAVTVGLFLGIFSPTLGFSLIILYFTMHGDNINQSIFNKVFKGKD